MSTDPPQPPEDGSTSETPSDLLAVEGLFPEQDDRSMRSAVVELPRATTSEDEQDTEVAEHEEPGESAGHYDVQSLPRGTQLGRYVILGKVRGGASEIVYGAYDPEGDRKISLKLFHPGGGEGDVKTRRNALARQAQAAAKISHACVEQILEAGVYGPWVFLATEFIDGIDLRHWMEARDDPFPWPEVLRVFREAGRGLAAAHAQGIVHHDFKPSNVLMGKEGRLVVVDFGLAAQVEEEDDDVEISQLRVSLEGRESVDEGEEPLLAQGTAAYMAPEQHLTGYGDARSDQFSFCVSLYEALYGERPFSGNRPRAIALEAAKHKIRPAPEGSSVPAWLRAVLVRGLSPRPHDRFASMEALLRELARDPAASRRRWIWGVAAVGGLAAIGGLVAVQLEADRAACEDTGAGGVLAVVWSAERREAIHEAFRTSGRRWAEPTWQYTESKLDAWADEWRDLSERACLATRVWEDASEREYQLRLSCLERHLAGFESSLDVLAMLDGPMVDHAHTLAGYLPPPRQCTDTETLAAMGSPPEEHREEVETLHRELSGLETRMMLGSTKPVIEALTAVRSRAVNTGDEALAARALLLLGRAQHAAKDLKEDPKEDPKAEASLHEAAAAGLGSGQPMLATHGWLARMDALSEQGRAIEASALGDYVEALVVHKHYSWLRPSLEITRGDAERIAGRPAEALTHYHAAIEHEEIRTDPDRLRLLPAWLGQSDVLRARGELDDALPPLQTALEVIQDVLGPHHPAAVPVLRRLGRVEHLRGKLADARAHLERALELVRETEIDPEGLRTELEGSLGTLLAAEGNPTAARPHLEHAYHALGGAAAATRPDVFRLGLAVAHAQQSSGDASSAREILEAVLAPFHSLPFPTDPEDMAQPTAAERAEAEVLLTTLMWQAGEQPRARERATAILSRLEDSPAHEIYRDEIEAWLQEHPASRRSTPSPSPPPPSLSPSLQEPSP